MNVLNPKLRNVRLVLANSPLSCQIGMDRERDRHELAALCRLQYNSVENRDRRIREAGKCSPVSI